MIRALFWWNKIFKTLTYIENWRATKKKKSQDKEQTPEKLETKTSKRRKKIPKGEKKETLRKLNYPI